MAREMKAIDVRDLPVGAYFLVRSGAHWNLWYCWTSDRMRHVAEFRPVHRRVMLRDARMRNVEHRNTVPRHNGASWGDDMFKYICVAEEHWDAITMLIEHDVGGDQLARIVGIPDWDKQHEDEHASD